MRDTNGPAQRSSQALDSGWDAHRHVLEQILVSRTDGETSTVELKGALVAVFRSAPEHGVDHSAHRLSELRIECPADDLDLLQD